MIVFLGRETRLVHIFIVPILQELLAEEQFKVIVMTLSETKD